MISSLKLCFYIHAHHDSLLYQGAKRLNWDVSCGCWTLYSQPSNTYTSHLPTRLVRHFAPTSSSATVTQPQEPVHSFNISFLHGIVSGSLPLFGAFHTETAGLAPLLLPLLPTTDQSSLNMRGLCSSLWPPDISSLAGLRSCFLPELRESQRERARSAVGSL